MASHNQALPASIKDKSYTAFDVLRLVCILVNLVLLFIQAVYAKLDAGLSLAVDLIYAATGLFFLVETGLRLARHKKEGTLSGYFKFNKAEPFYFLASLFIVPLYFFIPFVRPLRWVLVFKFPAILRRFDDEKVFQVGIRVVLTTLIAFFVLPFLNVIALSFSSPGEMVNLLPKGFTLYSVKYVLSDIPFYKSILISVFVTAVGTMISVTAMTMAAYPLSKPGMPLRKTVLLFFMIVMLFSGGMAPNILLVNSLRLTNTIWALIFPSVVMVFHLLLLKGFFESIPAELEESAKLDGANNYMILFKIIVPVSAPMLATVAFFTAINYWNNINNSILYITSNQSIYPLPMYIKNFLSRNPMDIAQSQPDLLIYWDNIKMSYIMLSIVPIACVYPLIFKYLKNGVSVGAVKG